MTVEIAVYSNSITVTVAETVSGGSESGNGVSNVHGNRSSNDYSIKITSDSDNYRW